MLFEWGRGRGVIPLRVFPPYWLIPLCVFLAHSLPIGPYPSIEWVRSHAILLTLTVYPVEHFNCGTVLNCSGWEAFCIVNSEGNRWVTINGEQYSDEQFADLMRHNGSKVMVIHGGM